MHLRHGHSTRLRVTACASGYDAGEIEIELSAESPWPSAELRLTRKLAALEPPPAWIGELPAPLRGPGLVGQWLSVPGSNAPNMAVLRGIPVPERSLCWAWAPVGVDGTFRFERLYRSIWLCLQRPAQPDVWARVPHPPQLCFAFVPLPTGHIEGRLASFDPDTFGHIYVVAFHDGPIQRAARVDAYGHFTIRDLPAGRYALRAGDDSMSRIDAAQRALLHLDDFAARADAWPGATIVDVRANEIATVTLP